MNKLRTAYDHCYRQLRARARALLGKDIFHNVNGSGAARRCLLVYITHPFRSTADPETHQNIWQAREMARIIGQHGYTVDVVDYYNRYTRLKHSYDLVIGLIPRGIDIYSRHLNPGCIRVAYLTSMNLKFTSDAEEKRIAELKQRRGASLQPRRFSGYISKEIESFDAAWYIGNQYNYHSYDCFQMPPVHFIKNSGYVFPWAESVTGRDPRKFVFLGSAGQVHKGLDLLLELFSEKLTDCTLYVCGCYLEEEDFCEEYQKELFHTPNIVPMGFVDIKSEKYRTLASECSYMLLPSCAEGCAGSVLTAMSAGLIPIVSRECGFEDDEVLSLPDCSKDTIERYIREYAEKDQEWIESESLKAIRTVRERYSKESFSQSVENALKATLKD